MRWGCLISLALVGAVSACGSSDGEGGGDRGPGPELADQDLSGRDTAEQRDLGHCTPGTKGTGEPCTHASECASCECEDVDVATKGQFRICTTKCTSHAQCDSDEVCLYPTVKACVPRCTTAADCPPPYNGCEIPTGTYKFCVVQ